MNKKQVSKLMAEFGRRGGKAKAKSSPLTPEKARAMVMARWKKSVETGVKVK